MPRTHASEGALHNLWAKALVIESGPGQRIVIVSTDVVGIPRTIAEDVAARVEKEYGIKRSQLLLNASHTHTAAPIIIWMGSLFLLLDRFNVWMKQRVRRRVQFSDYGRRSALGAQQNLKAEDITKFAVQRVCIRVIG
jgi:hypothetical protein